jgi:signal transduction histidine kinase
VGEVLALAIENEQLAAARREALEEVRDSRQRIVTAGDTERARIARDIHDTAQRSLMLLAMEVRGAARKPPGDDYAERLEKLAERLDETNDQLRSMVHGIMPLILTDRGLAAAVEVQVMGMPLRVRYTKPPPGTPRPAPETERAAYFLVSEGLTNIVKYAEATEAWVTIKQDEETLTVEVRDNGRGGADQALGSGLRGTEDRVAAIDGELEIISPPGEGTTLRARLPVAGRRSAAATPAR